MNDLYLMPNGDPSIEGYARKLMRRLEAKNMTSGSYVPHVPYRLLEGTRFGTIQISRDVISGIDDGYAFELSFRDKSRQLGKPDLADLLKVLFHDCDEIAQQTQEPGRLVCYHRDDYEQILAETPLADLVTDPYRPFFPPK